MKHGKQYKKLFKKEKQVQRKITIVNTIKLELSRDVNFLKEHILFFKLKVLILKIIFAGILVVLRHKCALCVWNHIMVRRQFADQASA